MGSVAVGKLKLGCETHQQDRLRFAVEDGLRTALPDERRLVLLRRMRIAGSIASPAERDAAVRSGWLAAVAGARHGGADGAGEANCVWFESREEAEALLLARLLAGRPVDQWYWRLALPDWRGQPLDPWLGKSLREALGQSDDRRLLTIADTCIAAGAVDRLLAALAQAAPARAGSSLAPGARSPPAGGDASVRSRGTPDGTTEPPLRLPILPPPIDAAVARLARSGAGAESAVRALLRAWILRHSPALALAPARLAAAVAAMIEHRQLSPAAAPKAASASPGPVEPARQAKRIIPEADPAATPSAASSCSEGRTARQVSEPSPTGPDTTDLPPALPAAHERESPAFRRWRRSDHAGLWLVVPSLVQLGFREWLAARPELLRENPAALLLHAIARRHRVDSDDPALSGLAAPGDAPLPGWTELWRQGLDRWLRRTVRRRLHDLVNRPGQLDWDEYRVEILFPAEAADLALRRRALDRDPGWTDWLGLSVRYHFGGEVGWL